MKRVIIAAATLLALGATAHAEEAVMPPAGAAPLLEVKGSGVQVYGCKGMMHAFGWVLVGPDATLSDSDGHPLGTHGAGPRWTLADGSSVVGEKVAEAAAPEPSAVAWLLLRVTSHAGAGRLAEAAWVRRSNTQGGVAPAAGCDVSHKDETVRVPYSATYQFFR